MTMVKIDVERLRKLELWAARYEFLRDEDNWGEDSGNDWGSLGEAHGEEFDRIVDERASFFDVECGYDPAL